MPSRRCPHCRVTALFTDRGGRSNFANSPDLKIHIESCQNDECGFAIAVVTRGNAEEVAEVFPTIGEGPDDHLPDGVKIAFSQALRSLEEGIWDACVLMCRRALEEATAERGAEGKDLFNKIEDLANKNQITPDLRDWAHEGRLAGKLGAHGGKEEEKQWNDEADAEEIVEFSKWFFRYVYVLPEQLRERRKRVTGVEEEANGDA